MRATSMRQEERFRVNFSVRFGIARDFVQEYAENLSSGGLFIRGAHRLTPGEQMVIELDLPGYDTFVVTAKVAHVITPAEALESNRRPGAGLSIVATPDGFSDAMHEYLIRLGRRRDFMVLASDHEVRTLFEESGYQTGLVPAPHELPGLLANFECPIVAVLVSRSLYGPFMSAAQAAGRPDVIFSIDYIEEFEEILRALDQNLS